MPFVTASRRGTRILGATDGLRGFEDVAPDLGGRRTGETIDAQSGHAGGNDKGEHAKGNGVFRVGNSDSIPDAQSSIESGPRCWV
jgi:hypothetical protein